MFRPFIFSIAVLFVACNTNTETPAEKTVAIAGSEKLTVDDYRQRMSPVPSQDSAAMSKKIIDQWAMDALLYQEAKERLEPEEISIEREVQEYRKSLVNQMYQARILEANLDTSVSQEEIEAYYNDNRESFVLRENLVKVFYIKMPVNAASLPKLRRLVNAVNPREKDELKKICTENAVSFFINDSTWLFLDDIRKEIPALKDEPDVALSTGRVVEYSDADYYYYLRIRDVRVKNSLSPINFERANIRNFILTARKAEVIADYKQQLLEKATADKSYSLTK